MGIFDIFKKKKVEEKPIEIPTPTEQPQEEKVFISGKRYVNKECEICKVIIGDERYTKKAGHFFHNKCFRKREVEFKNG